MLLIRGRRRAQAPVPKGVFQWVNVPKETFLFTQNQAL